MATDNLTLDEKIQLAERVEFWKGRKPTKEDTGHYYDWNKDKLIYTGEHKGVQFRLVDKYDPSPRDGYEEEYTLYVSFQGIDLGIEVCTETHDEGSISFDGSKKIKEWYAKAESNFKSKSRKANALAYIRNLLSEPKNS